MADERSVDIVILNFRTAQLVLDCLTSLKPAVQARSDRAVWVVDNESGDGSADTISDAIASKGCSDWVTLARAERNAGFGAGNNIGIQSSEQQSGSAYVLLLNSDTLVRPGAIDAMVHRMEAEPDIGMLGPCLEWPDGTPQTSAFRYRSPISEFIAAAGTGPITKALRRWDVSRGIPQRCCDVAWVSYAAVMLRRRMLEQIGLLDDGYFMYFEDIDHCRRAKQAGWRVVYDPEPRVVHLRGGSSNVKSASAARQRRPRYFYESRNRYFKKFYGRGGLVLTNLLWHAGRLVSKTREFFGRPRYACDSEWWDNWTDALTPVRASPASIHDTPAVDDWPPSARTGSGQGTTAHRTGPGATT